jgi:hypothetical protein
MAHTLKIFTAHSSTAEGVAERAAAMSDVPAPPSLSEQLKKAPVPSKLDQHLRPTPVKETK